MSRNTGWVPYTCAASATIDPQEGAGGRLPRPRNPSDVSVISATAATSVLWTMTGPATRGRMCLVMIRRSGSPATLAASMYSSCRAPIVADLTTRATGADSRMPSGMTAGVRLPAKIDSTTTRMTTMGSASRTLTQPLRTRSADFSQKPAATPTLTPRATATTTTSKVARRTGRPPYSSLLRTSLPSSSVPSRWLSDGPFKMAVYSFASGL